MTTFNSWMNPKTEEVRIYINGLPRLSYNDKVWLYEADDGLWTVGKKIAYCNMSPAELENSIEFALSEALGVNKYELRTMSFDEILGLI